MARTRSAHRLNYLEWMSYPRHHVKEVMKLFALVSAPDLDRYRARFEKFYREDGGGPETTQRFRPNKHDTPTTPSAGPC